MKTRLLFRELLNELQKRIMLSVLRMVEHTYINIETKKLAEFLDIESDSELQEVCTLICVRFKFTCGSCTIELKISGNIK